MPLSSAVIGVVPPFQHGKVSHFSQSAAPTTPRITRCVLLIEVGVHQCAGEMSILQTKLIHIPCNSRIIEAAALTAGCMSHSMGHACALYTNMVLPLIPSANKE